jgi:hypothetical protein
MDKLLRNYSIDDITMSLIQKFLVCGVVRDFSVFPNGKVEIRKETRNEKVNLFEWKSTSIQQTNAEYHLIADGILTQKDYTLRFENPEKKSYIPVECTDSIGLYSNITFLSDFSDLLLNMPIVLTIGILNDKIKAVKEGIGD